MPAKYLIVLSERHTLPVHRYVILRLRFQFRKSQIPILWFQVHSYPYLNVIQPQLNIYSLYFHSIFLKTFFSNTSSLALVLGFLPQYCNGTLTASE